MSYPGLDFINLISNLFNVPISDIISDFNDKSLIDDTLNVSFTLLKNGVIPNIHNISNKTNRNIKLIKSEFLDDENIILFIIKNIDMIIRDRIIKNFIISKNIVNDFINNCMPIIMEYDDLLSPLYRNDFTRKIIINYLKDCYSKIINFDFRINNMLNSRLIVSVLIEVIYSSFTYNSYLSYNDLCDNFKENWLL